MQIVYRERGAEQELEVSIERPDATVADLAEALGVRRHDLAIDGRITPAEESLHHAGLTAGSVVGPPAAEPSTSARGMVVVRVVGGLVAGASVPLGPGSAVVGRHDRADVVIPHPAVSREHCRLEVSPAGEVSVTDLGSRNGTDVNGQRLTAPARIGPDDVVCLGGTVLLRVLPVSMLDPALPLDPVHEVRPSGTIPFTRAPRGAGPPPPPPIRPPTRPMNDNSTSFLGISMVLGPLILAGVLWKVYGNPAFALIAGMTPIIIVMEVIEQRYRSGRRGRRNARAYSREVGMLGQAVEQKRAEERHRRLGSLLDPAEALFRSQAPCVRLWERRPDADDFMQLALGTTDLLWTPPVRIDNPDEVDPEVSAVLAQTSRLPSVPLPVDLTAGGVVGLRGGRQAALAVARWLLCQAAVSSGPADVEVAILTDADRAEDWDWAKWLPHVQDRRSGGSARLLAAGPDAVDALASDLLDARPEVDKPADGADQQPLLLVVVDGRALLEGRPCPARDLLAGRAGPAAGIVITDRLPAVCTVTLDLAPDGQAEVHLLRAGETQSEVLTAGVDDATARRCARALARFEDPELREVSSGLPDSVNLLPLLGLPDVSGHAVAARWRAGAESLRARAVIGVSEEDVFSIDLDDDGPHGLIAGTTGSGKSELLRTLVSSLATGNDPEHLSLVLVDYKGGGALDECARLPHSVGLVTNLDEQLGARALRCLEAELRWREQRLREVGLSHFRDYQRLRDGGRELQPMPRLVIVIDEFATLIRELPNFVDSLVSIAQLGRSLGVHLIMATQRPAGSVSEAIKNNVKLRIALRLESRNDSEDVIDSGIAAGIGPRQWGRAFYRLSARETLPIQTALSTGISGVGAALAPLSTFPFRFQRVRQSSGAAEGPTDLHRLVEASSEAFQQLGMAPPRRPWPEPLEPVVEASDLPEVTAVDLQQENVRGLPTLALADDPDRQVQYPVGWDPGAGNLLLYGVGGAGTTSALVALALGRARLQPPDRLHVYALDMGAGDLSPLAGLAHTGAYVGPTEPERQKRLVRLLRRELDSRRSSTGGFPEWLVLLDNLGAFLAEHDRDASGMRLIEDLARVFADGRGVGIHFAVTAERIGGVPTSWAALTQQKLLFRLADLTDYGFFDVPRTDVPAFVPGRAVIAPTHQVVQVAWNGSDLAPAVGAVNARWEGVARTAHPVGSLPARVELGELGATAQTSRAPWWIPVGLGDRFLETVGLTLYEHEHALIAGPARSGRSSALCTLAGAVLGADRPPAVMGVALRRSPLRSLAGLTRMVTNLDDLPDALAELQARPLLVLVDDADTIEQCEPIESLLRTGPEHVHLIAAGRNDVLRRSYGHWTQKVRESRCGLLLMPDHDMDGELLSVALPRMDRIAPVPGRGYIASDGTLDGVQVAGLWEEGVDARAC